MHPVPRSITPTVAVAILAVFLTCGGDLSRAQQADAGRIRPDRQRAFLLCATGKYAVWLTSDLILTTARKRAPSYVNRAYRQALTEPDGLLVATWSGTGRACDASVMADGTVVLAVQGLTFCRPDGTNVHLDNPQRIADVYADGVLLHDTSGVVDKDGRGAKPVEFVPYRGLGLDRGSAIEVIPAGVKCFWHREWVRSGDRFAWIKGSTLHVFDLRDRRRTAVPLPAKMDPTYRVNAFDGETAVVNVHAFDAATGAILGGPRTAEGSSDRVGGFAIRDRIGYYERSGKLMAVNLASPDDPAVTLGPSSGRIFGEAESGLTVWNGERWVTVPWLRAWKDAGKQQDDRGKGDL